MDIVEDLETTTFSNNEAYFKKAAAEITSLRVQLAQAEQGWISVDDLWPERIEGSKILCFGNDYIFECEYQDGHWCNIGGESFTHWMPLPKPPVAKKGT